MLIKKILPIIALCFFVFLPLCSLAGDLPNVTSPSTGFFDNPLKAQSIMELLAAALDIVIKVGLIVVVFFIILSGFNYVTARGDSGKVKTARDTLVATLVGAAIILGSYAIVKALQTTVNQLKTGTGITQQLEVPNNFKV